MYMYVCMYVCMYIYACMYVCTCTCTCMYLYTYLFTSLAQCSPDILGCDQGCGLDELNNITCLCNPGYILTSDGTTCGGIYVHVCTCM